MSESNFYSYDNNIEVKKKAGPDSCKCVVEQYMNVERTFAPPESLKKLEKHLKFVISQVEIFNSKTISLFQDPITLMKTNLFRGPKRVKVSLKNSSFQCISGALHYQVGEISVQAKTDGFKLVRGKKPAPIYSGTGDIYLEPCTANTNFVFVQVNGVVTVDKGVYYASQGTLKKKTVMVKSLGSALFGGEGLFEHQFTGKGWLLLRIPVYESEIHKIPMKNSTVKIDGPNQLLRKGNISFKVEAMGKGLGKLMNTSGEGWVNVYKGTGEIWIAPTLNNNVQSSGLGSVLRV